jgi:hypothetical protein
MPVEIPCEIDLWGVSGCGQSNVRPQTWFESMTFPARLIDGYRAFIDTRLPLEREWYHKLAEAGQRPDVMVICCCD